MSQKQDPPENKVLKENNVHDVAQYIKSKECKNIVVMLGAGVSTSAGIPDFRSPETGLYANLARLRLPYPEAVFEINYFRRNPVPFYTLAQELYPGKFRPTLTHSFMKLLFKHNLLHHCFTQNIDTLELRAGVPPHKVVHAHGSFASQRCIDCGEPYDDEKMKEHIMKKKIAICGECAGLVKPDIVFFGEALPDEFTKSVPNVGMADLLIVIGTSLTVYPFASLAQIPSSQCPRVLINMEKVGNFGSRRNDTVLLGKCDDVVRDLARELGWEDELQQLWEATTLEETSEDVSTSEKERKQDNAGEKSLQDEVNDLMDKIAKDLTLDEDEDRNTSQSEEPEREKPADGDKQEKSVEVTLIQGERPSEDIIQKLGL